MLESTLPPADRCGAASDELDVRSDEGLRQALGDVAHSASWDTSAAKDLLAEVRRRAVRNAAHVAAAASVVMDRGLVDDVLLAAWMVLRHHGDKVAAAARPWAYLMSSAQKQVFDDVRAQQLLTNAASVRGRAREVMPLAVRPVGSTPTDLATALRHEPRGASSEAGMGPRVIRQVGRHERLPLLAEPAQAESAPPLRQREPWLAAFVDLLVRHGAVEDVTVAAVDRLADLFGVTYVGRWEWAARRDPVLAQLGLSPDQCAALVALLAGSRQYRHNGRRDSLLGAVRTACELGVGVDVSPVQRRRIDVYATKTGATPGPPHNLPSPVAADAVVAGVGR